MAVKKRLDCLLVERGLVPSREQAKIVIMEGKVYVDRQAPRSPRMPLLRFAEKRWPMSAAAG